MTFLHTQSKHYILLKPLSFRSRFELVPVSSNSPLDYIILIHRSNASSYTLSIILDISTVLKIESIPRGSRYKIINRFNHFLAIKSILKLTKRSEIYCIRITATKRKPYLLKYYLRIHLSFFIKLSKNFIIGPVLLNVITGYQLKLALSH